MNLNKLNNTIKRPPVYEKGNSFMWTDEYISKQLLEIHLNPDLDLASRTTKSINKTIDLILKFCDKPKMEILDLGCGPGLYTEKLAEIGHIITGVDISKNSISYAKDHAKKKNLHINYFCNDYLTLEFENKFDLIMLIYTDFGVLIPPDRKKLLSIIFKALKPGGSFIFDVVNDKNSDQKFQEQQTWSIEEGGFWNPKPYLELTSSFNYKEERVFLKQHTIIDETDQINNYRFWTHYFSTNSIIEMLSSSGFIMTKNFKNILPATNIWNGNNVTFYKTQKT